MPEGIRWSFQVLPSRTMVCPALLPPWKRTTASARSASRSVIFPLPSSPHWAPTTTIPGMTDPVYVGRGRRSAARRFGSGVRSPGARLRRELVRVVRERLASLFGHEHQVLEAHAADLPIPQSGLDREHVAGDQRRLPALPEAWILVHAQADAVPERELKALGRVFAWAGSLGAVAGALEHVANQRMQLS